MKKLFGVFISFLFILVLSSFATNAHAQSFSLNCTVAGNVYAPGSVQDVAGQRQECTVSTDGRSANWRPVPANTPLRGSPLSIQDIDTAGVRVGRSYVDNDYPAGIKRALTRDDLNNPGFVSMDSTNRMADFTRRIAGCVRGVTCDQNEQDPAYLQGMNQGTAIAFLSNSIVAMYSTPPANTYAYVRDISQTLGFAPKSAYAQGIGFSGLAPLLPLWKIFRNIAYALLAVVMIVIGFMVMLRKKIDPKTVVTVQNSIPRIVITLLLITFSYAIVGILIDAMYIAILLAVALIKTTGLLPEPSIIQQAMGIHSVEQQFASGNLLSFISAVLPAGPVSLLQSVFEILGLGGTLFTAAIGGVIGGIITAGNPLGIAVGAVVPSVLITFLLTILVLFGIIRIFFVVLSAYIHIILALLFGPILLLMEAIPGSQGFSGWIKNLISNILVFPVIGIMGMVSLAFSTSASRVGGIGNDIWIPPYSGTGGNVQAIAALFSLGILLVIPQTVNSIKEAFKAKAPIPITTGFGQAISSPAATGLQLLSVGYYLKGLTPKAIRDKVGLKEGGGPSTHSGG